jgi:hypothetical protein
MFELLCFELEDTLDIKVALKHIYAHSWYTNLYLSRK